jgi:pimeloyl-ACP methyl ester carboxylesterase
MLKMWKSIKKVSFKLSCLLALLVISGAIYQFISTKLDEEAYPPPGKLIDVGGYRLHLNSLGQGSPVVVLDAGMGCNSLDWVLIQPEIAKSTQVCSYDRAGYGWSDESPLERTSENIVEELHTLLKNAKIPGPYILVGHSFGGVNVRLFASKYPDEIVGVILVDASHEDQFEKIPEWPLSYVDKFLMHPNIAPFLASIGLARLFNYLPKYQKFYKEFPQDIREKYVAATSTIKFISCVTKEFDLFKESLKQLKNEQEILQNPLTVITAGKLINKEETGLPDEFIELFTTVWETLQKDLVTRSVKGKQLIAKRSGHMITHEQPEMIVEAIQEMLH